METPLQLIDDHLDGELADDGFRQLDVWLRDRDEHVREFAKAWLVHSLVHDFISQRQVQADALLRAMTTSGGQRRTANLPDALVSLDGPARERVEPSMRRVPSSVFRRLAAPRYRLAGLAALVLVTLVAGGLMVVSSRPKVVAMLTQSAGCRWLASEGEIADGALFREGDELRLAEGRALLTFSSGARVIIEGPTRLTVRSELAAELGEGALMANVPRQAVGFTITTPRARFVDLGTAFTVRCRADASFELQVFEGMVEVTLAGDQPLQISEGTAVKAGATSRSVASIPYDVGQKIAMP